MIKYIFSIYQFSRKVPSQLAKQVYMQKLREDDEFKQLLKKDQQTSLKQIQGDNYMPEPKRGDSRLPRVKDNLKETNTHITEQKRLDSALKSLQVKDEDSKAVIKNALKEEFFLMKKLSEENAKIEEEMKVKKRKKELKDIFKQIEEMDIQPDDQNAEQIPYFNKLSMEEKYERIADWNKRYDVLGKVDPYLLQRARTSQNIENFIQTNFEENQKYFDQVKIKGGVSIGEILTNRACTVVWIYINFLEKLDKKEQNEYLEKLNKNSKQLSWQMCQDLGLKYGPDIRFSLSRREEKENEIKKEMDENAKELVKQDLIEKYQAGEIPRKIKKSKFNEIVQELKDKKIYLTGKISNSEIPSSKSKADEKEIHNKKSNQNQKSSAEKFWDQL
ncbi:unnamed protein product [Paramecium pentaurelia]|uniref:Uncharacterized protein n=1 Tax=Paramecium pentaurelia TaxID=43138 RepID=A0A8S1SY16_9CILI|nr:unnamed protein product [Paramecium pentaurelia]